MAQINLNGDTSGSIALVAPTVAGTNTITLPATTGTAALTSDVIGVGQTWTNVTASRAVGTTYTNSTGKPIQVNICVSSTTASASAILTINGTIALQGTPYPSANSPLYVTAIVPNGATYAASVSTGTGSLVSNGWFELR